MMEKIKIACTSSGGLDPLMAKMFDIDVIPIRIEYQGKEYHEGVDLEPVAFFQLLSDTKPDKHNLPKTVVPEVEPTESVMEKAIAQGYTDIIFVCMSTKLGSAYNKIRIDSEKYEGQIRRHFVDTKVIGFIEAYMAFWAGHLAKSGKGVEEILNALQIIRENASMTGACTNLDYPVYNGRLKGAQAFWGRTLHICPAMEVTQEGELVAFAKALHPAKSYEKAAERLKNFIGDSKDYILWRFYTGRVNERKLLRAEKKLGLTPNLPDLTMPLSTGVHTGPTLAGWGVIKLDNF
jgi:DegV family protein with EDD domain